MIFSRKPVFGRGNANSLDETNEATKQYKNKKHSSTKLTPKQASPKKN